MLVLTLYDGEAVHIGDDIKIVMDRCIDDGEATRFCLDELNDAIVFRQGLIKSGTLVKPFYRSVS